MNDRDLALSAIQRLPESVSLREVSDEIELIAALRDAVEQADEGKIRSHDEVKKLLNSWVSE